MLFLVVKKLREQCARKISLDYLLLPHEKVGAHLNINHLTDELLKEHVVD